MDSISKLFAKVKQLFFFMSLWTFLISYCASRYFLLFLHSHVNLALRLAALSRKWHKTDFISVLLTATLSYPFDLENVPRPSSWNYLPLTVSRPCCKPSTVTKRTLWMSSLSTIWKCCHVIGLDCPSKRLRPVKSRVLFCQSICNIQGKQHLVRCFLKICTVRKKSTFRSIYIPTCDRQIKASTKLWYQLLFWDTCLSQLSSRNFFQRNNVFDSKRSDRLVRHTSEYLHKMEYHSWNFTMPENGRQASLVSQHLIISINLHEWEQYPFFLLWQSFQVEFLWEMWSLFFSVSFLFYCEETALTLALTSRLVWSYIFAFWGLNINVLFTLDGKACPLSSVSVVNLFELTLTLWGFQVSNSWWCIMTPLVVCFYRLPL